MTQILYLYADTNLFIQCRDLRHLDWSIWNDFKEVHIMVSRPVQREIDNQKNRGNDRVGSRARKTYTIFREIAIGEQGFKLLQESRPRVKLFLEAPSIPSSGLSEILDYSKPDDEIVGCMHRFAMENPESDTRLLTYDAGPMMTARQLDLTVEAIREDWILQPEKSRIEKENSRLRAELDQLKKAEPTFSITCISDDAEIQRLEFEYRVYKPLSSTDISEIINLVETRYPIVTEFNLRRQSASYRTIHLALAHMFSPVSDIEIAKYRDEEYPNWIEECEDHLSKLHEILQEKAMPQIWFVATNNGSRPGKDVLVTLSSVGNFQIHTPHDEASEASEQFPRPPKPPRGQWNSFAGTRSVIPSALSSEYFQLANLNQDRDRNAFYYKPRRPSEPVESFELECEQWRHSAEVRFFGVGIFVEGDVSEIKGAVRCEIHAENLSFPVRKVIPVRGIVREFSTPEQAEFLVRQIPRSRAF